MASLRLCYNFNKHTSDYDSILWLRPASWAVAVIGPLVRMNICGIVNLAERYDHSIHLTKGLMMMKIKARLVKSFIFK
jgi:hypothetical protein